MKDLVYLLNYFITFSSLQLTRAQIYVPPILVTCPAVPEDTGGTWYCDPPTTPGYPVHTGTMCVFLCNGVNMGAMTCSNLGKWDKDPNEKTCEGGETSTTTMEQSTTTKEPSTTTIEPSTITTMEPTTPTKEASTTTIEPSTITTMEPTATTVEPSTTTIEPSTTTMEPTTTTKEPSTTTIEPSTITTMEPTTTTVEPSTTTIEISTTTMEPFTTTIEPSTTTMEPYTTTTQTDYVNCPFNTRNTGNQGRSLYCPQSYCPAVYIASTGSALENQPDSIGCFNYEGSLMADEYPNYINSYGRFLTPHAYSNPVLGYTVWLVSDIPMDTNGTIRNNKHDDMFCPYDMLDGWEYRDARTGQWVEDTTMTVKCVGGS